MSQGLNINENILPSQNNMTDSLIASNQKSLLKQRSFVKKYRMFLCAIIVSLIVITTFSLSWLKYSEIETEDQADTLSQKQYAQKLIIDSEFDGTSNQQLFHNVKQIELIDQKLKSFDTTPFPNLLSLFLSQNLKLENLVINNTQLTEFQYSSSQLKTLKLINNTKLTTFLDSNLPSLTDLIIVKTPLSLFSNNTLSSLHYIQLVSSNIQTLQLPDIPLKTLFIQNCGKVQLSLRYINKYKDLQSVVLVGSTYPPEDIYFQHLSKLRSISIRNSTFLGGIVINNCSLLQQLNIQLYQKIKLIHLNDLQNLHFFFPKIKSVDKMDIYNVNIHDFTIETEYLHYLIIGGKYTRKIQQNIPGLTSLHIVNSQMSDTQFSSIKTNSTKLLSIESCNKLTTLDNQFINLQQLSLVQIENIKYQNLIAPKLKVLIIDRSNYSLVDTSHLSHLNALLISFSKIQQIIVNSPVWQVKISHQNASFRLKLNSQSFSDLEIIEVEEVEIENYSLNKIVDFELEKIERVKIQNNTFGKSLTRFILTDIKDISLKGNKFDFDEENKDVYVFIASTGIEKLEQQFDGAYSVALSRNNLTNLSQLVNDIGNVPYLYVAYNKLNTAVGMKNNKIKQLRIRQQDEVIDFSNNQLEGLERLAFENYDTLEVFRNNTLPNLKELQLKSIGIALKEEDLLEEFRAMKEKGTELKLLIVNEECTEGFEENVKEIFEDIEVRIQ